jgi:hypothetical protein
MYIYVLSANTIITYQFSTQANSDNNGLEIIPVFHTNEAFSLRKSGIVNTRDPLRRFYAAISLTVKPNLSTILKLKRTPALLSLGFSCFSNLSIQCNIYSSHNRLRNIPANSPQAR